MKLLQFLFLCFVSSSVYAQFEFSEHMVFDDSQSAYGVNIIESADMDANGYEDIVFYAEAENKLAIIPNGPNGFGDQIVLMNDAESIADVDLVDVDKDGDLDVTIIYHNIRQIYALINEAGNYTETMLTKEYQFYFIGNNIDWVDIDGDGRLDVVSLVYNDRLHYLRNVSQEEFRLSVHNKIYSSDGRLNYELADIDQDGLMDVITADANRVIIHRQVSSFSFEEEVLDIDIGHFGLVRSKDIDYDGDMDIVVMQNLAWEMGNTGFIRVFENSEGEWLHSSSAFDQPLRVWDFNLVDIDYDNDLDIVGIQHSEPVIVINDDNSYDEVNEIRSNAYRPVALLVSDFDKDIDLDIVIANELDSAISCFENTAQGFQPSFLTIDHVKPSVLVSGDSNGDEYEDVLVGFAKTGELIWYEGNGQGFDKGQVTSEVGLIVEIENIDIDGDGVQEYYTSSHTPGVLGLFDFSADEQEWKYQNLLTGISSNALGVGLSNDGMTYNILSSAGLFTSLVMHRVYVDIGLVLDPILLDDDIGFVVHSKFHDLNGDGFDDIIYSSYKGELKVIWNIDDDEYSDPVQIDSTGYTSHEMLIEDFNNDGVRDIIITNSERDALAVYLNNGEGQLETLVWDAGVSNMTEIHMADIDNDGDLDLMGGLQSARQIAIFEYDHSADEYLAAVMIESELDDIAQIISQDVDQDGDKDIIGISFSDSSLAWYENQMINSSANDLPQLDFSVSPNPVRERLQIKSDGVINKVVVRNAIGLTVYDGVVSSIEVGDWQPGVYFVSIISAGYSLTTKPVVVY